MRKLALLTFLFLLVAVPARAVEYQPGSTIVANETPVFGGTVSFTETYPREAAGGGRTPQFPDNPNTQVMCYQNSMLVWVGRTSILKGSQLNIGDGFRQGVTGPLTLGGRTGGAFGDLDWVSGPATCTAYLYSSYQKGSDFFYQIVWATLTFEVTA